MLANANSLAKNYSEGVKNIDTMDSLYQIILRLAKDNPEGLKEVFKADTSSLLKNTYSQYMNMLVP